MATYEQEKKKRIALYALGLAAIIAINIVLALFADGAFYRAEQTQIEHVTQEEQIADTQIEPNAEVETGVSEVAVEETTATQEQVQETVLSSHVFGVEDFSVSDRQKLENALMTMTSNAGISRANITFRLQAEPEQVSIADGRDATVYRFGVDDAERFVAVVTNEAGSWSARLEDSFSTSNAQIALISTSELEELLGSECAKALYGAFDTWCADSNIKSGSDLANVNRTSVSKSGDVVRFEIELDVQNVGGEGTSEQLVDCTYDSGTFTFVAQ